MAFPTAIPITLDTCVEVCTFLGSLVEPFAFHNNSLALILNATGEVSLTNNGMKIITETYCSHPLAKLIVGAIQNHYELTGDGSKSYILLLRHLLLLIRARCDSIPGTMNDFFHLTHRILPSVFRNIRFSGFVLHHNFEIHNFKDNLKLIELLTQTFFQSKYSSLISRNLSSLLSQFISQSITDWAKLPILLAWIIPNFNSICSRYCASIQESYILEGIVIENLMNKCQVKKTSAFRFVVIENTSRSTYKDCDENVSLMLDNSASVSSFLESNYEWYKEFVALLCTCDISVAFALDKVNDEFCALCSQRNILLIDRISKEDMQCIIFNTNVIPLNNLNEIPHPENIGHMECIEGLYIGQKNYLHIRLTSDVNDEIVPHHLFLCAPVENLCKQYIMECINCLKVVQQSIITENSPDIQNYSNRILNNNRPVALENLPDRSCISEFHNPNGNTLLAKGRRLGESITTGHSINLKPQIGSSRNILSVVGAVGKWETALINELLSVVKYFPGYANSASILCESLQVIFTHKNYSNNSRSTLLERCSRLPEFQHSAEVNKKLSDVLAMESDIEPICNKELLIFNVITLLLQLMKIDGIVCIKKAVKT